MFELDFKLQPSRQYCIVFAIVLLLSMMIIIVLPLSILLKIIVSVFVLLYGAYIFWRYILLYSPHSIICLQRLYNGMWQIQTNKTVISANLCADSTVTSWVSALRFKKPKTFLPISCILFRDSLTADNYRKLLIILRRNHFHKLEMNELAGEDDQENDSKIKAIN